MHGTRTYLADFHFANLKVVDTRWRGSWYSGVMMTTGLGKSSLLGEGALLEAHSTRLLHISD
jgi:hypothetical protein